ncbi:MAG: hypothetical protein JW820_05510 [Spirochaetales bacterium]|nr:hypothetical protein [Spirochaetales bacterium]
MSVLQLRNHIPVGGPSTREPADGTESPLRVSLGFEPAWYHRRCGVSFTEEWYRDPFVRFRGLERMIAELKRAFPSVPYWEASNRAATISGIYGIGLVPGAFGMPILYAPDRWPTLDGRRHLGVEQMERLTPEGPLHSPLVEDLFRQMELIEREWGLVWGYPNWQGVLNTAFNLRGAELFTDMYDRPGLVHHFLGVIAEVMIRLARMVEERQRQSGFDIDLLSVSNCVMNMISPEQYRAFVQPQDRRIAESFARFGVHTCEWDVTPYIEVLSELPKLGYLDMGIMSDLPRVRRAFPETRRALLYSAARLNEAGLEEIRRDMEKIARELAPCDVIVADILADTPDGRVRELLAVCRQLEGKAPELPAT